MAREAGEACTPQPLHRPGRRRRGTFQKEAQRLLVAGGECRTARAVGSIPVRRPRDGAATPRAAKRAGTDPSVPWSAAPVSSDMTLLPTLLLALGLSQAQTNNTRIEKQGRFSPRALGPRWARQTRPHQCGHREGRLPWWGRVPPTALVPTW